MTLQAKEHNIPFYIAAPISTIDFNIRSGKEIVIEERDPKEVTNIGVPKGITAANPAFDVTPAKYIKGIVTEKGIVKPKALVSSCLSGFISNLGTPKPIQDVLSCRP